MEPRTTIAHFASSLGGGANLAGLRLHYALCRQGVDSRFYHGAGEPPNATCVPLFQNRSFWWRNLAALATSWRSRQWAPDGFVTGPGWVRRTPIQALGTLPRVVNLHWVARWLDLPSFLESLPPGLPVVWTLHDLIPVTGGCHYPGDCDGFTKGCGNCPQQKRPGSNDATRRFYRAKERLYRKANLHLVGNSEWTTAQAKRSGLAAHARSISTIHYGLNIDEFSPVPKTAARQALGIPEGKFVVGFSCLDFGEKRKGAALLMEAMKGLPPDETVLLVLGAGRWPASEFQTIPMGSLNAPRLQSVFYSALDVFAMPSRAETFGNVAMEAMACETPVVAFAAGGLADVVVDGETGLLETRIGDVPALAQMLRRMRDRPGERVTMGRAGRQRVRTNFSDSLMAKRYITLFDQIAPAGR